jgi:hypothetical protein
MQVTRWLIEFRQWIIYLDKVQKSCKFGGFGTLFWYCYNWKNYNYKSEKEIQNNTRGLGIR